jgi:hypothetical protein
MPAIKRQTMGAVASLHLGSAKKSASTPVSSLTLTFTGIVSDMHGGPTRVAGSREPAFKRGTRLANLRQVSLVSMEELDIIASRMGIKWLDPGWLAANIATEGAGPITQIPRGTIIRFPSGASLYVSDLNSPCSAAASLIRRHGRVSEEQTSRFVPHSRGRRGLLAFVYAEGEINAGNPIEFLLPQRELPC